MALLWADGFDHYGSNDNLSLSYERNDVDLSTNPTEVRTGEASVYFFNNARLVRPLENTMSAIMGFGLFQYNTQANAMRWGFRSNSRDYEFRVSSNNAIEFFINDNIQAASPVNTFVPGAYGYLETRLVVNNGAGSLEIRLNNNQVLLVIDQDFGLDPINQFRLGRQGENAGQRWIDDLYVCDSAGAYNNDFLGDIRCRTFTPASNGPLQEWAHTGATAYEEIDNVPFDNAKYISTPDVGDRSNFGHSALPINTAYVAGVVMFSTVNKTDAGACEITPQISSNGTVSNGDVISPGTASAIYSSVFQVDPDTGGTFTPAGFDAALMQVERTA